MQITGREILEEIDPTYQKELWWKDNEGKYQLLDNLGTTKDWREASEWISAELPDLESQEHDSVFEKRVIDGNRIVAYRRFRIRVISQTIETVFDF